MNTAALPMDTTVLAMNGIEVLRMRGCLTGAVRIAYEAAEIQAVVVRNFSPALPRPVQRNDVVEALSSRVRQQVCFL
jgi:hypothetical protein